MKKALLLAVLTVGSWTTAQSQIVLNEGQTYSYIFQTLAPVGEVITPPPGQGQLGRLSLLVDITATPTPSTMRVEFFQGGIGGPAAFTQDLNFPLGPNIQFRVGDLWEDLQGSFRLTMVEGQLTVNTFSVEVELPTATAGLSTLYGTGSLNPALVVPEPSTWALGGMALLLTGCVYFHRRRNQQASVPTV